MQSRVFRANSATSKLTPMPLLDRGIVLVVDVRCWPIPWFETSLDGMLSSVIRSCQCTIAKDFSSCFSRRKCEPSPFFFFEFLLIYIGVAGAKLQLPCVLVWSALSFFVFFFRNSFFFFFFCLFSLSSHALCTWTSFGATSRSPIYCLHVTEFVRNTAKGRQQWFARVQEVALKASAEPQIFISAFEAFLKIFCIAQKHLHFPQFFSALNATCFRQWEKKKKERSPQKFVFNIPPNVWFIFPSSALKFFAPFGTKYMHRNTFSCFCTV